tara:strand:- start:79 stop:375 length:297 start_codon:yes stop_codon:yes gene_type:complete
MENNSNKIKNHGIFRVIVTNIGMRISNEYVHIVINKDNPYLDKVMEVIKFKENKRPIRKELEAFAMIMDLDTNKMSEDDFYKLITYVDYADVVREINN